MINYAFLGLGFVQAWLWLFFLNGPLLFSEAEGWSVSSELILLSFLLATSLSYLWLTKRAAGSTPLYSRNLMIVTSALLMAGGVLVVKFTAGQIGEVPYVVLALIGTVAAGFGSTILIVALGELFSVLSVTAAGLSFAGSVTVGTALFFGALKLTIPIAFMLTALSPIIALLFIFLSRRRLPTTDLKLVKSPSATFPFPRRLVFLIILFYLTGGFFYKMILLSSTPALQESYWLTNVIYCLVIIVAGGCLYLFPNLDLSVLYRPVLPLLGAGFVLMPFFNDLTIFLPLILLQSGFALFDLYTWLLFAYIAKSYLRAAYVFGWGMFLITISIFVGETLFATLFANITFSMEEIKILSLCAALLMMAGTMLFQGKRDSFAGWEGPKNLVTNAEMASTLEFELDKVNEINELEVPVEQSQTARQKLVRLKPKSAGEQKKESRNIDDIEEQFFQSIELTKREREVAQLLFEGRNNPFIRGSLNISNNTLKTHLKNIYRKAMVDDRQKLLDLYRGLA